MLTRKLTFDTNGWPDRIVRMVERFISSLGKKFGDKPPIEDPRPLPLWPGVSLPPEKLRRVEIYQDVR